LKNSAPPMNKKFSAFVIPLVMAISFGLTGCATASSGVAASSQLYQPRILALPAGQPIQTSNGIYTPQTAEVWHSPTEFKKIEAQVIDLAAALDQVRNQK
jgi:hypothetical protein